MTTLIGIFVLFLPFVIAQLIPTWKWLMAYFLAFSTAVTIILLAILHLIEQTISSGKDLPGRGLGEGFIFILVYLFAVSGMSGIISKAIFLYMESRSITVLKWATLLIPMLSILVTFIFPITILIILSLFNGKN